MVICNLIPIYQQYCKTPSFHHFLEDSNKTWLNDGLRDPDGNEIPKENLGRTS